MTRASAACRLSRLARSVGLEHPVSPHSLRRTFCTAGLISGVPLRDMQYAMRHADSRTTLRYDMSRAKPRSARRPPSRGLPRRHGRRLTLQICIPDWYHHGMSIQIAVRLPDDLVAYVDQAVASGRVKSRAELVARLLARDARRHRAEQDLQRFAAAGALDDADALAIAVATASTPITDH